MKEKSHVPNIDLNFLTRTNVALSGTGEDVKRNTGLTLYPLAATSYQDIAVSPLKKARSLTHRVSVQGL